jgi:PhnB protein
MADSSASAPLTTSTIAPWFPVDDGDRAVAYYLAAFGAVERERLTGDDGRVAVARLSIGEATFWVQTDPDATLRETTGAFRMILTVDDPDAVFRQALLAGATEVSPITEDHGWRTGRLVDPFGYHWEIGKPTGE